MPVQSLTFLHSCVERRDEVERAAGVAAAARVAGGSAAPAAAIAQRRARAARSERRGGGTRASCDPAEPEAGDGHPGEDEQERDAGRRRAELARRVGLRTGRAEVLPDLGQLRGRLGHGRTRRRARRPSAARACGSGAVCAGTAIWAEVRTPETSNDWVTTPFGVPTAIASTGRSRRAPTRRRRPASSRRRSGRRRRRAAPRPDGRGRRCRSGRRRR